MHNVFMKSVLRNDTINTRIIKYIFAHHSLRFKTEMHLRVYFDMGTAQ